MTVECVIKLDRLQHDRSVSGKPRPYFFKTLDQPMTDRVQELEQELERLRLVVQERDAVIASLRHDALVGCNHD